MAQAINSNAVKSSGKFPLSYHKQTRYYYKTIKGRRHYFGRDKDAALELWHKQKDALLRGERPRDENDVVTIAYVCNYCLTKKKRLVDQGELSLRQYNDLTSMAKYVIGEFGRNRSVAGLSPDDFGDLRAKMVKRWAPSGLVARIGNIKHIFEFAYKNDVIREQVKFGDQFKTPSKRQRREARSVAGEKMFEAHEINTLLKHATPHVRAFVLLGVNAGLGNSDIARMEMPNIDLELGWLNYPRPKTAVPRRAKLWPETVKAIGEARKNQPVSRGPNNELVFLTRLRKPWSDPHSSTCALAQAFRKLANETNLYRRGRTFYALRHVCETIGGECKDQVAVDVVMGHESPGMASEYRERISDQRLETVADTIYSWLHQSEGKTR